MFRRIFNILLHPSRIVSFAALRINRRLVRQVFVSLSHVRDVATATVVLDGGPPGDERPTGEGSSP